MKLSRTEINQTFNGISFIWLLQYANCNDKENLYEKFKAITSAESDTKHIRYKKTLTFLFFEPLLIN